VIRANARPRNNARLSFPGRRNGDHTESITSIRVWVRALSTRCRNEAPQNIARTIHRQLSRSKAQRRTNGQVKELRITWSGRIQIMMMTYHHATPVHLFLPVHEQTATQGWFAGISRAVQRDSISTGSRRSPPISGRLHTFRYGMHRN
jgi:hypothetical protein